jgi:hypothetical protein
LKHVDAFDALPRCAGVEESMPKDSMKNLETRVRNGEDEDGTSSLRGSDTVKYGP